AMIISRLPAPFPSLKNYFKIFIATVIPTFFLSILWAKLPGWLYALTAIASFLQLAAWILLLTRALPYLRNNYPPTRPKWIRWFLYAAGLSITVKCFRQSVSVLPCLRQLLFGFLPVVPACLPLVLGGVYSLFLLASVLAR